MFPRLIDGSTAASKLFICFGRGTNATESESYSSSEFEAADVGSANGVVPGAGVAVAGSHYQGLAGYRGYTSHHKIIRLATIMCRLSAQIGARREVFNSTFRGTAVSLVEQEGEMLDAGVFFLQMRLGGSKETLGEVAT